MNNEFKKINYKQETRYILETTSGATSSAVVATSENPLGELQKRHTVSVPVSQKPRQGPLRPQTGGGAHRDKKKEQKQGKEKHRKPFMEDDISKKRDLLLTLKDVNPTLETNYLELASVNELEDMLFQWADETEQKLRELEQQAKTNKVAKQKFQELKDKWDMVQQKLYGISEQGVAEGRSKDFAGRHYATKKIDKIIKSFVSSPVGQKYAKHDCKTVTRAFVHWADQNQIPTQVITLAPPSAVFIKKNPRFLNKYGEGSGHIMPVVGNQAIDFTVRQFGVNRPFERPLITPVADLPSVYGRFGYFTDRPEWFLGGKTHWIGPLNQIPAEILNQEFGDEILEQGMAEGSLELDHEISMASSELQSIVSDARKLLVLVKRYSEMEGLEAWQQSKITKAADYMTSVLRSISNDQTPLEGRFGRSSYYNPMDYERNQQRQMDNDNRAFKQQELDWELRHEKDEPYRPQSSGMYFYNVKPGQENDAMAVGLKQTKNGKWYSKMSNPYADKTFGPGKFWQPKSESISEASKKPTATTRHLREYPVSDKDVAKPVKPEKKDEKKAVAEGFEQKTFKVVYYSPGKDRNITKTIKANNESDVWDQLKAKGIDVVSVKEQGVAEGSLNEFYDEKAHKPEGGKLDRLVRRALANKVSVFAHIGGVRSGYVKSEHPVKGFLVIGSGRNKNYITFDDQKQKATMDAGRVYIQPRSEWTASREIDLDEQGVAEGSERPEPLSIRIYDKIEELKEKLKNTNDPDEGAFYRKKIKDLEHKLHSTHGDVRGVVETQGSRPIDKFRSKPSWDDGDELADKNSPYYVAWSGQAWDDEDTSRPKGDPGRILVINIEDKFEASELAKKYDSLFNSDKFPDSLAYSKYVDYGGTYVGSMSKLDDWELEELNRYLRSGKVKDHSKEQGVAEEKQKGVDGKACWKGYKRIGTKKKGGKTVDNCVKVGEDGVDESGLQYYTGVKKHGAEYSKAYKEEVGYDEVTPKSASYILRKMEQGVPMSSILDDFPELGRMMEIIASEQGLHPDDDFEDIEASLYHDLEDIAAQGDDFGDYDSDKEQPDEYMESLSQYLQIALNEKAVSKAQQRFMGMVHAAQKGQKPASKKVAKAAKGMGKKDAKDFAATKHKGLPEKKPKK